MMHTPLLTLTVRGTTTSKTLDARRALHNETAGSAQGMAAARAMTDLSHHVYVPCGDAGKMGGTAPDELLFVDVWTDPRKMGAFFANPAVQEQGAKLFAGRDATLWAPIADAFSFSTPPPGSASKMYLAMIRTTVRSVQEAREVLDGVNVQHLGDARRRGLVSHQLFSKFSPGDQSTPTTGSAELLGIDLWYDLKGMAEHYEAVMPAMAGIYGAAAQTSVWERAVGFNEW